MSNIITITKIHRLDWVRHVVRTNGERRVKKLVEGKTGGGRTKEDLD